MIVPTDIHPIATVPVQPLSEDGGKPGGDEVSRFQDVLMQAGSSDPPLQDPAPIRETSPGDVILQGLEKLRMEPPLRGNRGRDASILDIREVLKVQLQVQHLVVVESWATQVATKAENAGNSLLRNQ